MMYLFLVPALAAAIWAWRLAEGSGKYNLQEKTREIESLKNELEMALGDLKEAKYRRLHDASLHADAVHELNKRNALVEHDLQDCKQNWIKADEDRNAALQRIEVLDNEITGLNIDKLHLKVELASYREKQDKRREQKAASMRRFRAKNKEAKK